MLGPSVRAGGATEPTSSRRANRRPQQIRESLLILGAELLRTIPTPTRFTGTRYSSTPRQQKLCASPISCATSGARANGSVDILLERADRILAADGGRDCKRVLTEAEIDLLLAGDEPKDLLRDGPAPEPAGSALAPPWAVAPRDSTAPVVLRMPTWRRGKGTPERETTGIAGSREVARRRRWVESVGNAEAIGGSRDGWKGRFERPLTRAKEGVAEDRRADEHGSGAGPTHLRPGTLLVAPRVALSIAS